MKRKAVWAGASLAAALMIGGAANASTFVAAGDGGVNQIGDYSNTTPAIARDPTFSVAAVPEPATWAILILGLGMIGAAARRRRGGLAAEA